MMTAGALVNCPEETACANFFAYASCVISELGQTEIFRGSILTSLPLRNTAISLPARRCTSMAFATAVLNALLMIALLEKTRTRLCLREVFLSIDLPHFDKFVPDLGNQDVACIKRISSADCHQSGLRFRIIVYPPLIGERHV